jgi:aminopeptidase N
MGRASFDAFLRAYAEKFRWGIATTEDFRAMAEAQCACDLASLFNEWVYE